jgi:MscS family membrane protein
MVLHWWSTLRGIPFFKEPLFIKLLVVLATVIILHAVVRFLLYRLMRVATISHSYWDDVLTYGAMKPLPAAIWLWGISHMAKMIARTYQFDDWLEVIAQARNIIALILVGWFFWRMLDEIRQQFLVRTTRTDSQADQTTVDALCKLGYLTVTIITLITLLQTLGVSISGLLAAGGGGNHHYMRAHGSSQFNAHMAQTTKTDNTDFLARLYIPVLEWRIQGNACTQ